MSFTHIGIERLNVEQRLRDINNKRRAEGRREVAQAHLWDSGCDVPLALLISEGGTKTFRTTFKFDDKWVSDTLGQFPVWELPRRA